MKLSAALLLVVATATTNAFAFAFTPALAPAAVRRHATNSVCLNAAAAAAERSPEDEAFFAKTKELCKERNLILSNIKNARDLASVRGSPVQPGRMFRTGRVSDASEADLKLLFDELGMRTLVDLRSPTELKDDLTVDRDAVFGDFTNLIWDERDNGVVRELRVGEPRMKKKDEKNPFKKFARKDKAGEDAAEVSANVDDPGCLLMSTVDLVAVTSESDGDDELVVEVSPESVAFMDDDDDDDDDENDEAEAEDGKKRKKRFVKVYQPGTIIEDKSRDSRKERHFVSIMNELKYVKGTVSKVRKRDIVKVLIKSPGALVSKRVRSSIKEPFLDQINGGGLPMLNELLLRYGAPGIRYVLDLCKDRSRHPIAFYCTAGKDRTGMIAAIMLATAGVPEEDIVEDYSLSANVYAEMGDHQAMVGALSQRNLDAKTFLGAPPQVMRDTLANINENWGSVEGYLDWMGFNADDRAQLKSALLDP